MTISLPSITVLMPVYNGELYLAQAIESILDQTFADFEFIIINDGSTDRSLEILQNYAQKDNRIRLISRDNAGLIKTLNEGLTLASGQYIARMDSDDLCHMQRLNLQYEYLNTHPDCVAVGSAMQLIDSEGWPIRNWSSPTTHEEIDRAHLAGQGGAICHPSAMFRKQALNEVNGYHEGYIHAEDVDLFLRLAEIGRLANLAEVLYTYRQHIESVGYKHRQIQELSLFKALNDCYVRRGIPSEDLVAPSLVPNSIAEIHAKWAWWALSAGNVGTARKHAFKALSLTPLSLQNIKLCLCVLRGY